MKSIINLIILVIPIICSSQTITDDGYFIVPQYIVKKAPNIFTTNELNLLKNRNYNEYYKSTDSLIKFLKGKYVFSICFTYKNKRIYTEDYLSYISKGKIYCVDIKNNKVLPYKEIFKNYYGSINRFKQSKMFSEKIENFKKEYMKMDTSEIKTYLDRLERLNLNSKNNFPTDTFVNTLQKYISINPSEIKVLKYCYNKLCLFQKQQSYYDRNVIIDNVIQDALPSKKYLKFKLINELIQEKSYILNLYLNK